MWDVVENWRGLTTKRKSNVHQIDLELKKQAKIDLPRRLSTIG